MASPSLFTSVAVPYLPSSRNEGNFSARFTPTHLSFPRLRLGLSTVACSRRRSSDSAAPKKKKKQQSSRKNRDEEEEDDEDGDFGGDMDEDAFDALFKKLEEDLKNDTSPIGDNDGDFDDLTEEDFLKVEQALAEALLGDDDDEEEEEEEEDDIELTASSVDDIESDNDDETDDGDNEEDDDEEEVDEDGDDDDYEEVEEVKLKNWQLRRLASALKVGKRKTSIKLLAAELCLDRAVVLRILRDPPPKLLMYSATLPDFKPTKSVTSVPVPEEPVETVPETTEVEPRTKVSALDPVHVRQSRWTAQKGLKKVQAQTLEQVYRKSKRPTNAMINSIVTVTNLPRKRIVKWFEDKRAENGVIDKYPVPYQRSDRKTTSSQ